MLILTKFCYHKNKLDHSYKFRFSYSNSYMWPEYTLHTTDRKHNDEWYGANSNPTLTTPWPYKGSTLTSSQSWYQFTHFRRMEGLASLGLVWYNTPLVLCTTNDRCQRSTDELVRSWPRTWKSAKSNDTSWDMSMYCCYVTHCYVGVWILGSFKCKINKKIYRKFNVFDNINIDIDIEVDISIWRQIESSLLHEVYQRLTPGLIRLHMWNTYKEVTVHTKYIKF